ncbi:MAG TPA: glucosamine-6-phosphate deaminase [Planctomycetota bacterium]|nr:glucosamine-6-phosphate deaminase [Planctomycetota bacterium]
MSAPAPGLRVEVHADADAARRATAARIADLLRTSGERGAVLALPTGETPRGVYAELVRRHREGVLSFRHATTFGLDEFWPLARGSAHSFWRFLDEHVLGRVDSDPARRFHLDGAAPADRADTTCALYEAAIAEAGGLDLALLGLGTNGHIAFNEPGSPRDSRTRRVTLHEGTRLDLARAFGEAQGVPCEALTMGVATILAAREVVLLALGARKAAAVARMLGGPIGPECPASFVREHPRALFVLDREAAAGWRG